MTTNDLQTLPAGRELDIALAQAAGYTVKNVNANPDFPCYMLHYPASTSQFSWVDQSRWDQGDSEADAWATTPAFSTDNAASQTLPGAGAITVRWDDERGHWFAVLAGQPNAYAASEPLARCRAWALRK